MKSGFHAIVISALMLSACASTPTQNSAESMSVKPASQERTGFEERDDLSMYHAGTGLVCPAVFGDMIREDIRELSGGDANCGYKGEGEILTLYATRSEASLRDNFQGGVQAIEMIYGDRGLTLNPDMTQACSLGGLMAAPAFFEDNPDLEEDVYPLEAAVFTEDKRFSTLMLTEYKGRMIKIRYTAASDKARMETDVMESCVINSTYMLQTRAKMAP